MQATLDQSQIDALFAAQATGAAAPLESVADTSTAFDFGFAGQISTEQMRAISLVNDHFARNMMHTLGAWLRTQTTVVLGACEQMPFSEYLSRIPEPAYLCMLRLEPLGAVGLLELDLPLAMAAMELLLGGRGGHGEPREVTDIEDAILESVMGVIVRELNAAWQTVGLTFAFDKRDTDGRVPRLLPRTERTLCVSFEVHFLGVQGVLNFCLPAVVLNTVHRRLVTMREEPRPRFAAVQQRVTALAGEMHLPVCLRSQEMLLPSRAIAGLKEGTLLELPLPQNSVTELRLRGVLLSPALPAHRSGVKAAMLSGAAPQEDNSLNAAQHAAAQHAAAQHAAA